MGPICPIGAAFAQDSPSVVAAPINKGYVAFPKFALYCGRFCGRALDVVF